MRPILFLASVCLLYMALFNFPLDLIAKFSIQFHIYFSVNSIDHLNVYFSKEKLIYNNNENKAKRRDKQRAETVLS